MDGTNSNYPMILIPEDYPKITRRLPEDPVTRRSCYPKITRRSCYSHNNKGRQLKGTICSQLYVIANAAAYYLGVLCHFSDLFRLCPPSLVGSYYLHPLKHVQYIYHVMIYHVIKGVL